MTPGIRVKSDLFGLGTVLEPPPAIKALGVSFLWVQWDRTPPVEYNCGVNPCIVLVEECKEEKG